MNSITIATFNSLEPAEALKHRLEQAGIHAVVHDESKLQRYWFMSAPLAAQKVECIILVPTNAEALAQPAASLAVNGIKFVVIDSPLNGKTALAE